MDCPRQGNATELADAGAPAWLRHSPYLVASPWRRQPSRSLPSQAAPRAWGVQTGGGHRRRSGRRCGFAFAWATNAAVPQADRAGVAQEAVSRHVPKSGPPSGSAAAQ